MKRSTYEVERNLYALTKKELMHCLYAIKTASLQSVVNARQAELDALIDPTDQKKRNVLLNRKWEKEICGLEKKLADYLSETPW